MTDVLHPVLARDCHMLGVWREMRILLHRDAHVRWLILVPAVQAAQWHGLPGSVRADLMAGVLALSALLTDELGCDKVNLGAIGNMVSQFHFHVVGRWRHDPYWPGVVWGKSEPGCVYADEDVLDAQKKVLAALRAAP